MELQVGVKAIIKNRQGEFLILKRSPIKYPEVKNPWDIPGGRINLGSQLLENLNREIEEEIQIKISGNPVLIDAQDIMRSEKHVVRLTYLVEGDGTPILSDEHTDYRWVSFKEAQEMSDIDVFLKEVILKNVSRFI